MRSIFLASAIMLALGTAAHAAPIKKFNPQIQMGGDLSVDKMREQNLIVVKKAAEGIGETLPQRVDEFTKLTAIDANGTRLIYTFAVDAGPKSDEAMRAKGTKMAPRVLQGICTSAERFMEADISLTYRYINSGTKTEILRVDADKSKCPQKRP